MGTNFYLRRRLSIQDQRNLLEDIRYGNYDSADRLISFKVHIGKRSAGWKFLWDANNFEYFNPTKESIFDFLKSGRIFDEYGREFTFEEFINDEVGESLNTGYDLETYEKSNPRMDRSYYFYRREELERFREKYDQDVNEFGEFYIDDLRFTTSSEFS